MLHIGANSVDLCLNHIMYLKKKNFGVLARLLVCNDL